MAKIRFPLVGFIFSDKLLGLDNQDTSVFNDTLNFVKESGLSDVQITILTPFPGTDLYKRLNNTNRLLEDVFWDKCTLFDVRYSPSIFGNATPLTLPIIQTK